MPDVDIEKAIRESLADGKLPCEKAFAIARRFKIQVREVGDLCEAAGIRITDCQLGCFPRRKDGTGGKEGPKA